MRCFVVVAALSTQTVSCGKLSVKGPAGILDHPFRGYEIFKIDLSVNSKATEVVRGNS